MTQSLQLQTDAPVVVARLANGYVLDTLREGDDLKLVCDVQSNPPPTRVTWYHDVSKKKRQEKRHLLSNMIDCYSNPRFLVRQNQRLEHDVSAGILLASNSLTLRVLTLAHIGEYFCVATNAVGETHSPPLFINMKCE